MMRAIRMACVSAIALLCGGADAAAIVITEFPLPTGNVQPYGITAGPDGAVWFTESTSPTNSVGRIDVNAPNAITEFQAPTKPSGVFDITAGPDGNLWFTESQTFNGDRIGRMLPTAHTPSRSSRFRAAGITSPTASPWGPTETSGWRSNMGTRSHGSRRTVPMRSPSFRCRAVTKRS